MGVTHSAPAQQALRQSKELLHIAERSAEALTIRAEALYHAVHALVSIRTLAPVHHLPAQLRFDEALQEEAAGVPASEVVFRMLDASLHYVLLLKPEASGHTRRALQLAQEGLRDRSAVHLADALYHFLLHEIAGAKLSQEYSLRFPQLIYDEALRLEVRGADEQLVLEPLLKACQRITDTLLA